MKSLMVIPTFNGGKRWGIFLKSLSRQTLKPDKVLIIDSQSEDETLQMSKEAGLEVMLIEKDSFNHGGTRQLGVQRYQDYELIIFMTQDAVLADEESLRHLVECFNDDAIGAVYGRQLPRLEAGTIEAHARLFNYPQVSCIRDYESRKRLGLKSAFFSNSFGAYRLAALQEAGGFPEHLILGEDTYAAAKILRNGWCIKYCAEAKVFHSHGYSVAEEGKRYFDIGVFHRREKWLLDEFGRAEGEGIRFVKSEVIYLIEQGQFFRLPEALIRTFVKFIGYRLGILEKLLPDYLKRKFFSMHAAYWKKE